MARVIHARSPFYIRTQTEATAVKFRLELFIFTGLIGAKPATATYTLTKDTINSETALTFEISELIKDYFTNTFDGTYSSDTFHVIADVTGITAAGANISPLVSTTYLSFEGYTEYLDGANYYNSNQVILITASCMQMVLGTKTKIPVNAEQATSVAFKNGGSTIETIAVTDSGNTNQKIQYIETTGTSAIDSVVVTDSGASTHTITVDQVEECKFGVYKITFVNKHGALEDLFFFKKSVESLNVSRGSFKANLLNRVTKSYTTSEHQKQTFQVLANESISLNSGFVGECSNPSFEELLLSEYVWITSPSAVIAPVTVKESSLTFKTSLNDRLINYTVNFDYAFDLINDVR